MTNLERAEKLLLEEGYDVSNSPNYREWRACKVLGANQSGNIDHHDFTLFGLRFEFKTSRLGYTGSLKRPSYQWTNLLGWKKTKVGKVDFYLLEGTNGSAHYWLIPASVITKQYARAYLDRNWTRMDNWMDRYYLGDEKDLTPALVRSTIKFYNERS